MGELAVLALVGGLLAMDGTAVGQFMVSRPLVAGTLTGWMLGAPELGFLMGTILEIYLLVEFPVGGARFPEGSTATVIAVASAADPGTAGALALGLATGLVFGQVGGVSVTAMRMLNARVVPVPRAPEGSLAPGAIVRAHLAGIVLDFARGAGITLVGVVAGRFAVARLAPAWPLHLPDTRSLLLLGGVVSLGILVRSFGGLRRRLGLLGAGAGAGLLLGWLL
jgi:mannose/fructose/N-acetylgalactosamine-specific phosphotransferase system component IIC